MAYTQARLDAVTAQGMAAARHMPAHNSGRSGAIHVRRSVPKELYFNAICNHGVDPCDEGYWNDMERLHPWIKVPYAGKTGVRPGGRGGRVSNRFGRVKARFVVRGGKVIQVA